MFNMPMMSFFDSEMTDGTLISTGEGSNVKGVWTPGASTSTPIRIIAPQPVNANDLVNLGDGEHIQDHVLTWVDRVDVFTRDGDIDADRIGWNGRVYKVVHVDDRQELGQYMKIIMKRVG